MDQRPYQVMDAKGCWIKEIATLRRNVERFYLKGAMSLVQKGRFFMPFFSVRMNLRSSTHICHTLSESKWASRVIMSHGSAKYIPNVSQYSRTTMYDSMCTVELEYCIHLTPHTPPYCENERNDFLSHVCILVHTGITYTPVRIERVILRSTPVLVKCTVTRVLYLSCKTSVPPAPCRNSYGMKEIDGGIRKC